MPHVCMCVCIIPLLALPLHYQTLCPILSFLHHRKVLEYLYLPPLITEGAGLTLYGHTPDYLFLPSHLLADKVQVWIKNSLLAPKCLPVLPCLVEIWFCHTVLPKGPRGKHVNIVMTS